MISLISTITDKVKDFIKTDNVDEIKNVKEQYAGFNTIMLTVPNLTDDSIDDIFTMRKLNMLEISFLQYSIIYGAKKCFDYLINITETDNINLGRHSLHLATSRMEVYYIDQLLKKWGDNDIWLNIRDVKKGYTGLANMLVHEDAEYIDPFFNEGERTLKEIQDLKIKITEIFVSYPGLNVLLEDALGTVIFDVLENTPSDNTIKNILTTHKSMGEYQNIGLGLDGRRGDEDDEDEHEDPIRRSFHGISSLSWRENLRERLSNTTLRIYESVE